MDAHIAQGGGNRAICNLFCVPPVIGLERRSNEFAQVSFFVRNDLARVKRIP